MSLLAESSSRSAWNARAAVVRCSGAKVLRTPSHVNASFTAAIVVRSLWAELGEVWLTGVLLGWVVVRLVVCGLVVGSVVFAVDMWGFLSGRRVFNATHMRGFCGRELLTARMLTTPRTRGTLRGVGSPPRIATASTHHRRDEQSNADGNLTGQI